jgi:hypothetical protein
MIVVIDANVLLRFADPTAAQHPAAVAALSAPAGARRFAAHHPTVAL